MKTVTMLEFRKDAAVILERVRRGQHLLLLYRGRAAVKLEPVTEPAASSADDAFYGLADAALGKRQPARDALSNSEMDRLIYGE